MNLIEYVNLKDAVIFDFTDDGASEEYRALADVYEKFFVYMSIANAYSQDKENIMKKGADFSEFCKKKYGEIGDPDNNSALLQKIYRLLWDKKYLKHCEKKGKIKAETIHSQNTTLGIMYETCLEEEYEKEERKKINNKQKVSIRYIISRYVSNKEKCKNLLNDVKGLKGFITLYHTLGNFIPFPVGCNNARGIGKTKDYWDLALYHIHKYYVEGEDNLEKIVGEKNVKEFRQWLDLYKEENDKETSWSNFIEINFLQDFVNSEDKKPKELWKGHFSSEAIKPSNKDEFEQFYVNASLEIIARGFRILNKIEAETKLIAMEQRLVDIESLG